MNSKGIYSPRNCNLNSNQVMVIQLQITFVQQSSDKWHKLCTWINYVYI